MVKDKARNLKLYALSYDSSLSEEGLRQFNLSSAPFIQTQADLELGYDKNTQVVCTSIYLKLN